MSDHDNDSFDPVVPADPTPDDQPAAERPPAAAPAPVAPPVAPADPKARWRDRVFRMRAVAAVAVAGVIIGAAGGAATTALVKDGDHDRGRPGIGQFGGPGMPGMVPPRGRLDRQVFPGMPGDGSGDDSEGDDQESLAQS